MEKKDLVTLVNQIFIPLGFKNKGNNWKLETKELIKIVNLQKSGYSNTYYINYDYIIKKIPLDGLISHVGNRIGTVDLDLNKPSISKIKEMLILMKNKLESINTQTDIIESFKTLPTLNVIPLIVKNYFNIK